MFTSELSALWDDDSHLEPLEATELCAQKFGRGFPDIFDYVSMRGKADWDKEKDKHRKHETAETAGRKGLVSQSTQREMERTERTKRTVNSRAVRKAAIAETGAEDTKALLETLTKQASESKPKPATVVVTETVYAESTATGNYQHVDIDF